MQFLQLCEKCGNTGGRCSHKTGIGVTKEEEFTLPKIQLQIEGTHKTAVTTESGATAIL